MPDIVKVLVFSTVAYVFLFVIAKLLGKKQIAQLTFIDYVVGITIGSIAAEMATDTEQPFYHYLIAMAVFFLFDIFVSFIGRKGSIMKRIVIGKPLIVINEGEVDYAVLKKSKLTVDELAGLAREKGFFDLNDVAFAILETKGTLSILPKAAQTPVVAKDFDFKPEAPKLTEYMVTDGEICKDVLKRHGKTEDWLLGEISLKEGQILDDVLWAQYDEQSDSLTVRMKTSTK